MNLRNLPLFAAALLFAGCEDDNQGSDFERRYVLVAIPGFDTEDYAALLDHDDPNVRYLAVANLTASDAFEESPEEEEEASKLRAGLSKQVRDLLKDSAPKVRAIAAHSPANQIGPDAETGLIALLEDESDTVRVEALAALAKLDELSDAGIDAIAGQLDDENLLVRLHAVAAVRASCPPIKREAISTRLQELTPKRETAEQLVILQSLSRLGTAQAEQLVLTHLQSDDPRFVRAAAEFVPDLESDAAEPAILAALQKETVPPEVLLDLLTNTATGKSFSKATELLSSDSRTMRDYGLAILVKIGTEEARVALLDAYHQLTPEVEKHLTNPEADSESVIEEHAALFGSIETLSKKLGRLEPDPDSMSKLLSSGGAIEKRMVLHWLRQKKYFDLNVLSPETPGVDFTTPLLALAGDDSILLRGEALATLGHCAEPRAMTILMEALEDENQRIRRTALKSALKQAGNTGDRELLKELHGRRDQFVPETWDEADANLAIRLQLEEAVDEFDSTWVSRDRFLNDLDPSNAAETRLIAAAAISEDETVRDQCTPTLLGFLGKGTDGQKAFAIEASAGKLTKEHLPRLREIAASETDDAQKARLEELIGEIVE